MFDKDVGVNWHLRFRLKIENYKKKMNNLNLKTEY